MTRDDAVTIMRMMQARARSMCRYDHDEIAAVGILAAVEAAQRHTAHGGASLTTYAACRGYGEMRTEIARRARRAGRDVIVSCGPCSAVDVEEVAMRWLAGLDVADRELVIRAYLRGDALRSIAETSGVSAATLSRRAARIRHDVTQ